MVGGAPYPSWNVELLLETNPQRDDSPCTKVLYDAYQNIPLLGLIQYPLSCTFCNLYMVIILAARRPEENHRLALNVADPD